MSSRSHRVPSAPRKRSPRIERRSSCCRITKPKRRRDKKLDRKKSDELSSKLTEKELAEPPKDLPNRQINKSNKNHRRLAGLSRTTKTEKVELEDGEISEGDEDYFQPVCPFYFLNSCIWGNKCRCRHMDTTDKGNYVMFERVDLPLPRTQEYDVEMSYVADWQRLATEFNHSFDSNLHSLRQMMHHVGYNLGDSAASEQQDRPWVEFNDLDTDPYYTHHDDQTDSAPKEDLLQPHTTVLPPTYFPDPFNSIPYSQSVDWRYANRTQILSSSSSSSTPDYSSTTNSMTSSCTTMLSPTDPRSDSSSYYSSTHSSELSSSSMHSGSSGYWRGRRKIPLKDRKYRESAQNERKKLPLRRATPRKKTDLGKSRKKNKLKYMVKRKWQGDE